MNSSSVSAIKSYCSDNRASFWTRLQGRLCRWQTNARTRRQLAQLDAYQLKDIGVTRSEVLQEVAKPFWQD